MLLDALGSASRACKAYKEPLNESPHFVRRAAGRIVVVPHLGTLYVFTTLPRASTMYARMATQNPYVLMYEIGVKTLITAITAMISEAMNTHIDGG